IYDFQFGNELLPATPLPDQQDTLLWQGFFQVVKLKASEQLGATECKKDSLGEQDLCAPVYADYNQLVYGNCINSLMLVYGTSESDVQCGDVLKTFLDTATPGSATCLGTQARGGTIHTTWWLPDKYGGGEEVNNVINSILYPNGVFENAAGNPNHNLDLQHTCNPVGKCEKGCGESS
ncbi:hypothetical protein COT58_00025, partial [Candidatus Micrarchaeota archaeon CG09_land_8_20_14_0_10_60_16]